MIWQELSIRVPQEYVEPISYLFDRYGHGVSLENEGDGLVLLRTYLTSTSRARRARIEVGVNLVRSIQPMAELEVREVEEAHWETAWKSFFSLQRVGDNLVIKPSWIDYQPTEGEVVIELDPGIAFGTGYHPTTRMCLEALERLLKPRMVLLDLGAGSGILSMAASKLGASQVLALDVDPIAVKAARRNIRAAGLQALVRPARGTLPNQLAPEDHFDLAVANISSKIVGEKAVNLYRVLRPGGLLVAAGGVETQQIELEAHLKAAGFSHLDTSQIEEWVSLVMSKAA